MMHRLQTHLERGPAPAAWLGLLCVSLFTPACAPLPEAPNELSELARYLYREHEAAQPEVLEQGLANLQALLDDVDLEGAAADRAWIPGGLIEEDLEGISRPADRDLSDLLGITVAGLSSFPVADHALLQSQEDQLPAEPTATRYVRSFLAPEDPLCFADGECARMQTLNDARRENFLMSVDFMLFKDFVWSRVGTEEEAGQDRPHALVARSWFEESWEGDTGATVLWQSFSLDVWLEDGTGATQRFQTLWSESQIVDVDEDIVRNVLRESIDDIFIVGDEAIAALQSDTSN